MAKISTTELVNKVFAFCEAYSGVTFFPYQAQFGKRIVRSVLENGGEEITALFARQCIVNGSKIRMYDKTYKNIEDVKIGDEVVSFDFNETVKGRVINSYCSHMKKVYDVILVNNFSIKCTSNHRFLDYHSRLFKPLHDFEAGDMMAYINDDLQIEFSRIKDIKCIGDRLTYDLEIEGAENYVANNFLVHNSGKSEVVATISGGLSIVLPILANLPMFINDKRLTKFKNGLMIGIFAPSQRQAKICYNRMKKRMDSKHSSAILNDPEIDITFDVANGQNFLLSNGSLVSSQSASEGANIEGDSCMIIIVDEAQDVGNFKYRKCLSEDTEVWLPNGTKETIKNVVNDKLNVITLDGERVPEEFYNNGIQPVYELTLANGRKIEATENHQFYVRRRVGNRVPKWDIVSNIEIGATIAVPKEVAYFGNKYGIRQGQLVGFILGDGCMTGVKPMLCMNKKVRDHAIDHMLMDFENVEYYEVKYSESKDLSEGYFRRISRKGNNENELKTFLKELGIWGLKGSEKSITPQIFGASKQFLRGLVMGLIESDGCVSKNEIVFSNTSESLVRGLQDILLKFGVLSRVSVRPQNGDFGKNPKPIWNCTVKSKEGILNFYNSFELFTKQKKLFKLVEKVSKKKTRKLVNDKRRGRFRDDICFERVTNIELIGEKPTYCLKVEGRNFIANGIVSSNSISPMGAFYNATKILIGTSTTHVGFFYNSIKRNKAEYAKGGRRNHFEYDYKTVMKYNPNYEKYIEGEKKNLGEDSDEFQMAYCLKWILERGMFVDSILFDSLGDEDLQYTLTDQENTHVVGIDLGKKHDSTVVAVGEVDFDNPILVERSKDFNTPDYIAYQVILKNLLEIQGDDWESQYYTIQDFLQSYNIIRMVVDATAVGSPIADRFNANCKFEVVPYVFSKGSKSDLYKHVSTEFRAKRFKYPAHQKLNNDIRFRKFQKQFLDLEKSYSGQCMVVAHPDAQGAHDDYPDATALMIWGAKGEPVSKPKMSKNPIYDNSNKNFYSARNTLTARRR